MKIGVDIGGMSIKIGLVDSENKIIAKESIVTDTKVPYTEVVKDMANAIEKILQDNNYTLSDCESIGMGCPGTVDDVKGSVVYACNLGWENVPLVSELMKYISVPMAVANDADAAALGEVYAGAAKGKNSAALITLGTGVGGGIIADKKIFHGPLHGGCELGHMVIRAGGVQCSCGRKGCFETYASATALMRMGREAAEANPESIMNDMSNGVFDKIDGKIIFDADRAGDETAKKVVDEYEYYLSVGIANVINIFRPELIILGGGVAAQKEYLTDRLKDIVAPMCYGEDRCQIPEIVTSVLGNDAGIIGAANLV